MPRRIANPLPRVVIENITPRVDDGRHPIKRVLGGRVEVSAAIYKDGHDLLGARLLYRPCGEKNWQSASMEYRFNPDLWFADFAVTRLGRWEYTIEAWPDAFGTWQSDLRKRVEAGQDVASELLEGVAMLDRVAKKAKGARRNALQQAAKSILDVTLSLERRIDAALAVGLLHTVDGPVDEAGRTKADRILEVLVDRPLAATGAWYEMFPRSQTSKPDGHATFGDAARRLAEIADLGFDVIYLPPIHPIGRSYRKGRNNTRTAEPSDPGSPWAIGAREGGHTAVHPDLGTIDDFVEFVKDAERVGLAVALDYALQCSPDHPWVREHPDWFHQRPDGSIHYAENPPKKYEDIYPLNFWCEDRENMWRACRDIISFWIDHGVTIFRVDNPHTKPFAFWEWCIADVQKSRPDVIFLAEAFTRPNRMKGLAKIGFNQSYTYFTWKNTKWELVDYLTELTGTDMVEYYRPNFFANTPDILHEYLQTGGRPAFRIRLLLAATLSPVYGIYSGFELCENVAVRAGSEEYMHSEKYEVRIRDWAAPGNINADIRTLNRLRKTRPALQQLANLEFIDVTNDQMLCFRKWAPGDELLVVVNLDPHRAQETTVNLPTEKIGIANPNGYEVEDLLTGQRYTWSGRNNYVRLDPTREVAHLLSLSPRAAAGRQ